MAGEVSFTVGRAPIPFGRFSGYGDASVTEDQVALVNAAMDRYKAAALNAAMACAVRSENPIQQIFEWITDSTFTGSICDRADQMKRNIDDYSDRISDPNTTPDQLMEILGFIRRETDISDLVDLYNASSVAHIVGGAFDPRKTADLIPWWVWAIGGAAALGALGWRPFGGK